MPDPLPSGTVVVLRDASQLEVLLLARVPRENAPAPWVFPGGKVDAVDIGPGAPPEEHARRAAAREAGEEAGLALRPESLALISRWITPEISPRRFDTWYFATSVDPGSEISVDGQEIAGHRWLAPADALAAHQERALRLAPPTFVTVSWLGEFSRAADALRALTDCVPPTFRPRIHRRGEGAYILYPGDAGYDASDPDAAGPRHRLSTFSDPWRYERHGC